MYDCCEEGDPSSALEKLMSRVKEGQFEGEAFLRLLRAVQQTAPSSFPPPLCTLLEEVEGAEQEPHRNQTSGKGGAVSLTLVSVVQFLHGRHM